MRIEQIYHTTSTHVTTQHPYYLRKNQCIDFFYSSCYRSLVLYKNKHIDFSFRRIGRGTVRCHFFNSSISSMHRKNNVKQIIYSSQIWCLSMNQIISSFHAKVGMKKIRKFEKSLCNCCHNKTVKNVIVARTIFIIVRVFVIKIGGTMIRCLNSS